jgi:hypothetical protein
MNEMRTQDRAGHPLLRPRLHSGANKVQLKRGLPLPYPSPQFARKVGTENACRLPSPALAHVHQKHEQRAVRDKTLHRSAHAHPRLRVNEAEVHIPMKLCTCDPSVKTTPRTACVNPPIF